MSSNRGLRGWAYASVNARLKSRKPPCDSLVSICSILFILFAVGKVEYPQKQQQHQQPLSNQFQSQVNCTGLPSRRQSVSKRQTETLITVRADCKHI